MITDIHKGDSEPRARSSGSCLHGSEITILDGKLVYLGAFESRGAWDNFDPDDEWNFVNGLGE